MLDTWRSPIMEPPARFSTGALRKCANEVCTPPRRQTQYNALTTNAAENVSAHTALVDHSSVAPECRAVLRIFSPKAKLKFSIGENNPDNMQINRPRQKTERVFIMRLFSVS